MQKSIEEHMVLCASVKKMEVENHRVVCADGRTYEGEKIITTIPWAEYDEIDGMPKELFQRKERLRHSSVQIEYVSEHMDTKAQWIYYPEPEISYHRILVRHNFCPNSKGYWTETNKDRLIGVQTKGSSFCYMNEYAYPLNTIDKPEIMKELLTWGKERNIYGLGRWGEHEHYNSDLVVELAVKLAEELNQ